MIEEKPKDIAQSIRDKLYNYSKSKSIAFDYILRIYTMFQFLHRLSLSTYNRSFILKGGIVIFAQNFPLFRMTKDIDALSLHHKTEAELRKVISEICNIPVEDGLVFHSSKLKFVSKNLDSLLSIIRIKFEASLATANIPIVLDIGVGDEIFPEPCFLESPFINEVFYKTTFYVYPLESIISEKFQILCHFGRSHSRLKDILDIWLIMRNFCLLGGNLKTAIEKTFSKRNTAISTNLSIFESEYYDSLELHTKWEVLVHNLRAEFEIPAFTLIILSIKEFIMPILDSIVTQKSFNKKWNPKEMKWIPK